MRFPLFLLCALLLGACAGAPERPPAQEPAVAAVPPVGSVALRRQGDAGPDASDIVVQAFDRGLDADGSGSVFPSLRKAESIVLPVKLAAALRESGQWGVVRVVQDADIPAPLMLRGRILHADGVSLALEISLLAADGRLLYSRRYRDESVDSDYPVQPGRDPFQDIYHAIANDAAAAAAALSAERRVALRRVALMRFAESLAPATYGAYLGKDGDGYRQLLAYPADDDPMLRRIQRLQRQDDLFVDTVDQQYRELEERIAASYDLWRQYSRELSLYSARYEMEVEGRSRAGRRGSFGAMQQVYGSFRKVKLQEEDLRDLVDAFASESLETVVEIDDGVVRLSGSVEERYAEWRRILERIYALETGAPGPALQP
jgi:hypothetical protein